MPKITKTDDGGWAYKCTCGQEMVLYTDGGEKPRKLVKCFECQESDKNYVESGKYYETHNNNNNR